MRLLVLALSVVVLTACATGGGAVTDTWSAARTQERLAPYTAMPTDDLRAAANAAFSTNGSVQGAAFLYYALGTRLLDQSGDRDEAEDWLVRSASEPMEKYTSVRRTAAGTGAVIYAPRREELIGLPEAQFRLWELWRGSAENDAALGFLFLAARAGFEPAERAWARHGEE